MAKEITKRLIQLYHPERVYLFGSAARREAGPDSDYDIMVVVSDGTSEKKRDSGKAYLALWGIDASTDVLVWTKEYFESRLKLKASLSSIILEEGELLYAA